MSIEKLHQFDQSLFHPRGVCYWMCEYMMREGAWIGYSGKTYDELKQAAKGFTNYVACANWSKAKQNEEQEPLVSYLKSKEALKGNRVYRIAVGIGKKDDTLATKEDNINHEIMCITGADSRILVFDPNFGFYEFKKDADAETNREILKRELRAGAFYGKDGNEIHVFRYWDKGSIKS